MVTTCAYCGVGCAFKAELKGDEVLRMIPYKAGKANEGHSCVKGRFAYGYATHKDRILRPMIRERIDDPWREVAWDEALQYAASEFKRIQSQYGRDSVGAICRRAARTKKCSWSRSWCAPASATTMSTPAPVSAIRRPVSDCPRPTGLRQARRTSSRSIVPTSCRDRRQSDRRASGVRLAAEEATARRRPPHRYRPAPHRSRPKPRMSRPTIISR